MPQTNTRSFLTGIALVLMAGSPLMCRAQSDGMEPEWDVRSNLKALSQKVDRLKPLLGQVKAEEWVAKGASATYVAQLKSVRSEVDSLAISTLNLVQEPEKLTAALDMFFRMQSIETMLGSLAAGVRRYQNPALADLLQNVLGESSADRDRLRRYITDLAAVREEEFRIVDAEAQRCRGFLSRQPQTAKAPQAAKETRK